jgi:aryl-alcohol dehydrogenase-like predicted oxidoreductase
MEYRRVGETDLVVSEIAFGCGGNAGLMVRGDAAEQSRMVARALDLGITYFDNAPDYGDGAAERHLGRALRELKKRPLLNSKVEIRAENLNDIADHVVRSTEASLERLGVDYLDVLQIHNGPSAKAPKLEGRVYSQLPIEDYLRSDGAIEGVSRLLRDGKIRYAGFICRGNDADEVRDVLDTGVFRLINVPYTLLNPTAGVAKPAGLNVGKDFGRAIDLARERGAGAAIYSPLASGALTDDAVAGQPRHPLARAEDPQSEAARKNRDKAMALKFLADETGLSLAQAAFRFILMHDGVSTALGGFSSLAQLEEIAAVSGKPRFDAAQMARLDAVWRADFRA